MTPVNWVQRVELGRGEQSSLTDALHCHILKSHPTNKHRPRPRQQIQDDLENEQHMFNIFNAKIHTTIIFQHN